MTSADVVPVTVAKAIAELRGITGICKASWVESIVGVIEAESKAAGFWMQEAARDHNDLIRATARAEAAEAESARLREALTEMESMYTHCWDLADSDDKLMMEKSVGRFDEACRKARIALGTPLYGDNGEVFE